MADYSCYVTISTSASFPWLRLWNSFAAGDRWVVQPPDVIDPGATVDFQVDGLGEQPSQGMVEYGGGGPTEPVQVSVTCEFSSYGLEGNSADASSNGADVRVDIWTRTDGDWQPETPRDPGYPFHVFFGIRRAADPPFDEPRMDRATQRRPGRAAPAARARTAVRHASDRPAA